MPVHATPPAIIWRAQQQPPERIPGADFVVEVAGELPVNTKLRDFTRLLDRRHLTATNNRRYLPTILELITLVERNPARPAGRTWNSIDQLTMGYDAAAGTIQVSYCVADCARDRETGLMGPKRKMVSYTAPESLVVQRLDKKLNALKKYAK